MPLETGHALLPQPVEAGGRVYFVVADRVVHDPLILIGRAIDRVHAEPWQGVVVVRLTSGDVLRVRASRDGFFAVSGDPLRAFPGLDVNPAAIGLAVAAPGFQPRELTVPVPVAATFPRPAIEVELDRLPVTLAGRIVAEASPHAPIANARVAFQDAQLVLLRTPLAAAHPAGTEVRACHINPSGPARSLAAAVFRGATTLRLDDRTGLGVGTLLQLGGEPRWELAVIRSLASLPADPALPGEVTLRLPLTRSFATGSPVQPVTAADQPATAGLASEVYAGGGVLALTAAVAAAHVRIRPEASPLAEVHAVGALSDDDGYWRADGVDRPARAVLEATIPLFQTGDAAWAADFARSTNRIDFALKEP